MKVGIFEAAGPRFGRRSVLFLASLARIASMVHITKTSIATLAIGFAVEPILCFANAKCFKTTCNGRASEGTLSAAVCTVSRICWFFGEFI